tara:strand:+ start:1011 stop:1793 length:783 start_codon:yes stop_codon:yes gene_type:complete
VSINKKSIADLKNTILSPSLTSLYKVNIPLPEKVGNAVSKKIKVDQESISILCSSASLPGSSLMTHEIMNDRTGVSEFHAHRRQFDNKIELEFYVDSDQYGPIAYFEYWMDYISEYSETGKQSRSTAGFYTMQYPDYYTTDSFTVHKFEKDINEKGTHTPRLEYCFYNAFPLSINSMPVSYNTSSLLKCVVTMSYSRYKLENVNERVLSLQPSEKKKPPEKKKPEEPEAPDPTPAVEKPERMGMRNRMRAPGGLYGGRPL